ncbi:MAG: type II toxin-antitoxin system VapC family toxin [Treponema sp.]|nr:type II toxin-antitoxin system VapC family toxin [Candidatus Treponema caballi]
MYLLDTNVCISFMRNDNQNLKNRLMSLNKDDCFLSSVTIAELVYGVAKSRYQEQNRQNLVRFYTVIPKVLDFTSEDAEAFGVVRAYLEKEGTPIGLLDLQIASQALTRNLTVVTHNTSEFFRIPGLKVIDWSAPARSSL